MKKTIFGLLVVGAAAAIGVPYVTGVVAEKKAKELVDQFNNNSSHIGAIDILNYDRGFRSSSSSYKYTPSKLYKETTKLSSIEYDCDLGHGVTGVEYSCSLANKGEQKALFDKYLAGQDPFSMTGNISAFGEIDQTLSIDPVTINTDEGGVFTITEKVVLTTVYDHKSSSYDFSGEVPNLKIQSPEANNPVTMLMDKLVIEGEVTEIQDGLFVGDVNFSGAKLQVQGASPSEEMLISDFGINSSTQESGKTVSSIVNLTAKTATIPNQNGGTDSFSDVGIDLGMTGMDTAALTEYIKVNQDLQKKLFASDGDSQQALAGMADLIPVAEKLLKKDLGINFRSSAKVDGKPSQVALDMKLLNDMQFSQMMGFLFSPDETLKNFKGKFEIDLHKSLIEKYPQIAFATASLPVFEQKSDGVAMNLNLDDGLKLNGQQTTVEELQGLFR